ncbi:MAG: GIY-YIG nuclease family protein [Candidatus Doudnabacteria bacterium]|nr:GIY-YIG nuclease family protein [Candidatus Doudnabacteria bacterium]
MHGFVYILEDENNKYYIGSSSNVPKRKVKTKRLYYKNNQRWVY